MFFGTGHTEPHARRAAGLRTLAHLQERTEGRIEGQSQDDIQAARAELAEHLEQLANMVAGHNGSFPEGYGRKLILIQINAARDVARASNGRELLARFALPVLLFVAAAFAEGVIGAYAQKCLDILTRLLAK
jgi:hypothetical protein